MNAQAKYKYTNISSNSETNETICSAKTWDLFVMLRLMQMYSTLPAEQEAAIAPSTNTSSVVTTLMKPCSAPIQPNIR